MADTPVDTPGSVHVVIGPDVALVLVYPPPFVATIINAYWVFSEKVDITIDPIPPGNGRLSVIVAVTVGWVVEVAV